MSSEVTTSTGACTDYHVKDLSLATWGRKEMNIAETEMPGLMAIREEYAASRPLTGRALPGRFI